MVGVLEITDSEKTAMRKAILRQAMNDAGITEEEFFGRGCSQDLVTARSKAAHGLRRLGLSSNRIGAILKRDHSTVLNYFSKARSRRGNQYTQRRIFRHLPADVCETIVAIARAEDVGIEALIAQWVGERARFELEEKARAA